MLQILSIYFDPTTDFGFKKLFGEEANKDLLMDFLNSMLPKHHQIVDLEFQKSEQLPDHEYDRKAIFDILCKSATGERFIIEMQKSPMQHFMNRALYYTTFPIQAQAIKGKWDFSLSSVYFIAVLDFEYDTNLEHWKKRQLLRTFTLRDNNNVAMTDRLEFKFLQLQYFNKKEHELRTKFDKWCFFLKNLENLDHIPHLLNEPIFMKAFEVAEVKNMDADDYILYQISKSKKYDHELVLEEAERLGTERGYNKGMEKGMEKGYSKKEEEFVLSLHFEGFEPVVIARLAKVHLEKVYEIIEKATKS